MLPPSLADPVNKQYLDFITDDLGLTGSRTWEVGPRIDGTGMDHGDCDVIDWNLFESDTLSPQDATNLVYFQNKILAQGIQPNFYSSPGYPTHATDVKPWVMNHPGERAQQIWASALFYKTNCGININYAVIYNEPSMASTILADDIKALGPRFIAQGLATQVAICRSRRAADGLGLHHAGIERCRHVAVRRAHFVSQLRHGRSVSKLSARLCERRKVSRRRKRKWAVLRLTICTRI